MSKKGFIRVWQEMDFEEIGRYLLIAGDPTGDCANCKEVGIDISNAKTCPKCNTQFKYIATRLKSTSSQANRLKTKRPDLTIIELSDFKESQARDEARRFLK